MKLSLTELENFAKAFVAELPKSPGVQAHVVGLKGELGAGKTTFVQMVANELGITDSVTSPTFVLARVYPIDHPPFERFVHIDAYRLSLEDKDTIGWRTYVEDPRNFIMVEWPEHLRDFPTDAATLSFVVVDQHTRRLNHDQKK